MNPQSVDPISGAAFSQSSPAGDPKTWQRVLTFFDDRANPILVKELRQALRGKYFMVIFWLTLGIATAIGSVLLVSEAEAPTQSSGQRFFLLIFACFAFAICLFVPFAAFLSLSSEWDEDTHDMLVISNLRPWQIVRGKFLGAFFQSVLYGLALVPFLAFSFLLRGLDLVGAIWITAIAMVTSGGLISVSLAMSSASQKKFVRVLLMALLAVFLSFVSVGLTSAANFSFLTQGLHRTPTGLASIWAYCSAVLVVSSFALATTAARLTHPEENRSTVIRVLGSITLLVGLAWAGWFYSLLGASNLPLVVGTLGALWITSNSLNFMFEEERLGRRVRLEAPRSRILSCLIAPWFPGGGRAVLYFLVQASVLIVALDWIAQLPSSASSSAGSGSSYAVQGRKSVVTLLCYAFVYIGLPSALLSRLTKHASWRSAGRVTAVVLFLGSLLGPGAVGLLFGNTRLSHLKHSGNPAWTIERYLDGNTGPSILYVVWAVAFAVLALNGPRVVQAVREMLAASQYRCAAEARLAQRDREQSGEQVQGDAGQGERSVP